MPLAQLGKILMVCGVLLFVVGVVFSLGRSFGLGQLPGDFAWKRGNVSVFAPLATSIVLSIVLTVVLNLVLRFLR